MGTKNSKLVSNNEVHPDGDKPPAVRPDEGIGLARLAGIKQFMSTASSREAFAEYLCTEKAGDIIKKHKVSSVVELKL